jgi:hypothetical protein
MLQTVRDASDCPDEPDEPFSFNQSTIQAFYFISEAYDNNENELVAGEDWIGAFNGDVCVGAYPWLGETTGIPAMGDDGWGFTEGYLQDGDMPTFKIYDASADEYYEGIVSQNYFFESNGLFLIDRIDAAYSQLIDLHGGSNLVSFYTLPSDASLENMLGSIVGFGIQGVIGEGIASLYVEGIGWLGALYEFELGKGYWIILEEEAELYFTGSNS